jgi:ATP-binding cassette, subfamily C, bacterial exporter for protease/lipase
MRKSSKIPLANNEILQALYGYKKIFRSVGIFTAVINILLLVPSLYMLEVYDRVLTSRNTYTLLMLTLMMLIMYLVYAALEALRSYSVIEVGKKIDAELNQRTFTAAFEQNLKTRGENAAQALNDLTTIRQFVTGPSLYTFFDAPWFPLYLLVIFIFNFWLGLFATICTALLVVLAIINELVTHEPLSKANTLAFQSSNLASNHLRNADALDSMGMLPGIRKRWFELHSKYLESQAIGSQRAATLAALTKFLRITMQSLTLGLAAYLVLKNEISAGMMIAAVILLGKALSPVESVIAVWKQWRNVLSSYERLNDLFENNPPRNTSMPLPRPKGYLSMEHLYAAAPYSESMILKDVSFSINPGDILGVIGPSAAGKSTLAKIAVGLWRPASGSCRLDGADVYAWNKDELGPAVGYVPQEIEIFSGSISDNIARFYDYTAEDVVLAAKLAGIHEMILQLPQGYNTLVGEGGIGLSGGQKQRIALARAVYGGPSFLVLDEPNSNLDDAGERALLTTIESLREKKSTIILITHRISILQATTKLLYLQDGAVKLFGASQDVLNEIKKMSLSNNMNQGS